MYILMNNPKTHKSIKSFEEMTEASVDTRVANWKETYPEYFVVEGKLLTNESGLNTYGPHQIEVITFFRLNKGSDQDENGVVYLIEAFDGCRGILVYRYDVFTDCKVYDFLKEYMDYKNKLRSRLWSQSRKS